jgi:hypothetical protein
MQDVHKFDNKLAMTDINDYIKKASELTKEQKKELFTKLLEKLTDGMAKRNLNILINSNNYDPVNKLDADNLLVIIVNRLEKDNWDKSLLDLVNEQLKDMSLGFCQQGKTIRLLQIANGCLDVVQSKEVVSVPPKEVTSAPKEVVSVPPKEVTCVSMTVPFRQMQRPAVPLNKNAHKPAPPRSIMNVPRIIRVTGGVNKSVTRPYSSYARTK